LKRRQPQPKASSPPVVGIVVRREARGRFDALTRKSAGLPAVVSWDRRRTDRRASTRPPQIVQRKTERRQKPPFTWEVADFLVWDGAPQESAPAQRATDAKKPQTARKKRG